jgi:hypothetical protein
MASRQEEKARRRAERLEAERRAAAAARRRRRLTVVAAAVCGVLAVVVVGVVLLSSGPGGGDAKATPVAGGPSVATAGLPGAQTGPAPWANGAADALQQRLRALGLPLLEAEGTVLHIHQHLDLFVAGRPVTVPAGIGIDPAQHFISPLHTHDTSGVLHVESPTQATFTLGQVFGVWGVPLTRARLGGLRTGGGKQLRAWVDGKPFDGDPGSIVLAAHQELVVAYGTPAQMPEPVPAGYDFPPGE